jgi:cytochrome P450
MPVLLMLLAVCRQLCRGTFLHWAIIAILVPVGTYVSIFFYERWEKARVLSVLGGPVPFPVIGMLLEMRKHTHELTTGWRLGLQRKYGKAYVHPNPIWTKSPCVVMLSDPLDLQYILRDNFSNFTKPFLFEIVFGEIVGDGIFNAQHAHCEDGGAKWRIQRKTAAKMFTRRNFRDGFFNTFLSHGSKVLTVLEGLKGGGEECIDFQSLFFKFTLDSIAEIAFGADTGCLDGTPLPFAIAFDKAQTLCMSRLISPLSFANPYSAQECAIRECTSEFRSFSSGIIATRKADPMLEEKSDLLSMFMTFKDEHTGKGFDDGMLHDVVSRLQV